MYSINQKFVKTPTKEISQNWKYKRNENLTNTQKCNTINEQFDSEISFNWFEHRKS